MKKNSSDKNKDTKRQSSAPQESYVSAFYKQGSFFKGVGQYPRPCPLTEKLI
tara:strand:+ start:2706 stop:2861 length:156 start_codon:yes stop_codon:yes gene_type:complete